jgi:hypothetical protein
MAASGIRSARQRRYATRCSGTVRHGTFDSASGLHRAYFIRSRQRPSCPRHAQLSRYLQASSYPTSSFPSERPMTVWPCLMLHTTVDLLPNSSPGPTLVYHELEVSRAQARRTPCGKTLEPLALLHWPQAQSNQPRLEVGQFNRRGYCCVVLGGV